MLHTVIFMGRSGAGKGTQSALLRERIHRLDEGKHSILYVETGEHFRRFIRSNFFSAELARELNKKGERQPAFLAALIWGEMLVKEFDGAMHLVFDGAPRTRAEAEILTTALHFYKREKPTVIYLNVSTEWAEERLLGRGRTDDKDLKTIDRRLSWFDTDVMPAVEYFRAEPYYRFIEINGEQSIEKVHRDIIAAHDYTA